MSSTPELRQKLHQLGVDLLRMSPQHAMGAALELHEPGILHHLGLSSGRSVCRQDAIGVAVQNERRYSVAREVLTEVLNPGINASKRADRRSAGGHVPVVFEDPLAHELASRDIVVVEV